MNQNTTKKLADYPDALTVKDAAEILRISHKTLYHMIRDKQIPAILVGREKRIAKQHLEAFLLNKNAQTSNPASVTVQQTSKKSWTYDPPCGTCVDAKVVHDEHGKRIILIRKVG